MLTFIFLSEKYFLQKPLGIPSSVCFEFFKGLITSISPDIRVGIISSTDILGRLGYDHKGLFPECLPASFMMLFMSRHFHDTRIFFKYIWTEFLSSIVISLKKKNWINFINFSFYFNFIEIVKYFGMKLWWCTYVILALHYLLSFSSW